jgi:hypothetical protein
MGATAVGPRVTLAVTVKPRGDNKSGRLRVPVGRIESVYGFTHCGELHSWIGLTPVEGIDPLEPYTFVAQRRLEIAEPPWKVAATLVSKGVDLARVHEKKDASGKILVSSSFAVRDQVIAVVPKAVDSAAHDGPDLQGSGCTLLRSGAKLSGYRHPEPALLDQIFGDRAVRIPTSSGDQAAVLPEFYRGSAGYNTRSRLMFGITMGEAPDATTMRVETSDHVQDISHALVAGAQHLQVLATHPRPVAQVATGLAGH